MAGINAPFPPWSDIPNEILERIAVSLVSISDYINFRSVCRSWRSAAAPGRLREQPPVLLLPYDPFTDVRSFYSLATGRVHDLTLPRLRGCEVLTSDHGWLVLLDVFTEALSLLNPVTGASIDLPPTNGFRCFDRPIGWVPFLSSSPSAATGDCYVMVLDCYPETDRAAACRLGDADWTVLEILLPGDLTCILYRDVDRSFYSVDREGGNFHMNPVDSEPYHTHVLQAPVEHDRFCLLSTSENEFLLCGIKCSTYVVEGIVLSRPVFSLYSFDFEAPFDGWHPVCSVGDAALFFSPTQLLLLRGLRDFPELMKDCIYASCDLGETRVQDLGHDVKVDIFDLEMRKTRWRLSTGMDMPAEPYAIPLWVTLSLS